MKTTSTLTSEDLIGIGFEEMIEWTGAKYYTYNLGIRRELELKRLSTAMEKVTIQQIDTEPFGGQITDTIVLRNYEHNGYTTLEDIKTLITGITGKEFK